MKLLPILLLLALAPFARTQTTTDGVVKATVTMLGDGRHKNMVVDPDKKIAEETIEDSKGKLLTRTVYALDERNQTTGATFYDAKGKVLYKATYKRDSADRISEEMYYSTADQLLSRRVYTYGANNRITRLDMYDANGTLVTPPKPQGPGRPDKKKR